MTQMKSLALEKGVLHLFSEQSTSTLELNTIPEKPKSIGIPAITKAFLDFTC